jgi:hypothetical protein
VIDGNGGDSSSELFNVGAMTLTPSGSLIVVNNRGESVREYDRTGRFMRNVSRKGAGPGEYQSISDLRVLEGDTMVFWDASQRRITLLGPDRRHVRTISALRVAVCCAMSGVFADHESGPSGMGGVSFAGGAFRYTFGSVASSALDTSTHVAIPGYTASFTVVQQEAKPYPTWVTYGMPFTIQPMARFGADELVVATGERFEYQVFDRSGKLIRTVRAAASPRPVTNATIAEYRAGWKRSDARYPGFSGRMAAAFDTLKLPKTFPAYDRLIVEEDGTVWLRDYLVADSLPRAWAKFNREGKLLGTLVLAPNLIPRFSRGQAIITVQDTTVDFQRVAVYPIVRK